MSDRNIHNDPMSRGGYRDPVSGRISDLRTGSQDLPPWLEPVSEALIEKSQNNKRSMLLVGASLALVGIFMAGLYFFYLRGPAKEPLYVKAPVNATRERPNEPGGLDVPHQDKKIFDRAAGYEADLKGSLGAGSEQPVDVNGVLQAQSGAQTSAKKDIERDASAKDVSSTNQIETVKTAQAATGTVSPALPNKSFTAQLGAYGSEEGAVKAWKLLSRQFSNELKGLEPFYQPVLSGERTLYRLRIGPLRDRSVADSLCTALKAKDQACLVIKP